MPVPQAKDITGELGKLRKRKIMPEGTAPPMPLVNLERKPAFNAISFFFWTIILFFISLQMVFFIWLLRK